MKQITMKPIRKKSTSGIDSEVQWSSGLYNIRHQNKNHVI